MENTREFSDLQYIKDVSAEDLREIQKERTLATFNEEDGLTNKKINDFIKKGATLHGYLTNNRVDFIKHYGRDCFVVEGLGGRLNAVDTVEFLIAFSYADVLTAEKTDEAGTLFRVYCWYD